MSLHKTRHLRRARRTNERARLALLNLESRLAPANITVLNADESGAGSLRQAILDTNGMAGPDTIDFSPTFFATPQLITLLGASGQLDITDDLVITGPGAARLTISGNNEARIFNVDNATAIINVTISGMTVTGGNGSTGGGTPVSADGGGIRTTNEVLTLENMVINGNATTGVNDGGGFTATSTAFITLRNSTVSGNTTGGSGGGFYFFSGGGMLIENSTISGNTSTDTIGGGGFYFFGTVATGGVTIRNSTISGNSATGPGGGIVLRSLSGNVLVQNSTISNNLSGSTGTGAGLGGGGISVASGSATSILTLQSSIVAGNTSDPANGRDDIAVIDAATVTAVNSAIGDADGFTLSAASANNLAAGANLDLQPLGDNGGPTQTIGLGAASMAINAGVNPFPALRTDQRGGAFVRSVGPTDIGAFEVPAAAGTPTASGTFPVLGTLGNAIYTFSIAYADNGSINAGSLGNNDVRVTGPNGYNQLATFGTFAAGVATYSITAPGATFINTDNGVYTIAIEPGAVTDNLGNAVPSGANGQFLIDLPGTYTVTNLNDAGPGSLRQALLNANFSATVDTVAFQTGLTGTITLTSGQLVVSNPVSIVGPGAAALTVSGGNTSRIFNVENANSVITVSISGLTVTGGNGTTGGAAPVAGDGGGIRTTNEILTLDGVVITGNATTGANDGGGFTATAAAFVTIRNSTISGNTTGGAGGGIYFLSGAGTLIENSTISGNTSTDAIGGGGIYFFGTVPASGFTIRNSTIAGNSATGSGGGIVLRTLNTVNAPILIQNSTITNNSSATTATTVGVGGGGIAMSTVSTVAGATAIVTIQSTIVSGNTADAANGRSDIATVAAGIVNVYNSAIGDADGFTIAGSGANLPIGAALNLQPLASYGGPTATIGLGPGSMALNAGINTAPTLNFDQRGTGFPRQVGAGVDIGDFEGVVDLPIGTSSFTNVTTGGATSYPFSVTYTSGSPINLSTLDNNDIRITGPGGFNVLATRGTINSTNPLSVIVAYSFTPPTGAFDQADNGLYTVTLQAGQVANNVGAMNVAAQLGTFQVAIPGVFTVINLNDAGAGSLRQAILDANAGPTPDIINFQAGLTGTITLTTGQMTISEALTINGPGAGAVTVSGGGASRIFNVENAAGVITVSISGLTVSGGNGTNGGAAPVATDGGGIRTTDEILTLENMVITGNSNADDVTDGGGVSATSVASITIRNSTISGNTAGKNGGGIYFFSGGGLLMENSTVSGNVAPGVNGGGGIYFFGTVAPGGFTIRNSTIAGNSATVSSGGGIVFRSLNSFTGGPINIQNSTIANNSAGTASTADGAGGGGIAISSGGVNSILTLQSTIVSGNTSDPGNGRDDIAALPNATVNAYDSAISDGDGFTLTGNTGNLSFGVPLNLQPLGNNGGPTQTIALGAGSLAIDGGANTTPTLMFDQRGAGFARNVNGVDIGAFEVQGAGTAPTVTLARVNASASSQRSRVTSLEVTFSTQVAFAGAVANAFTITRTGGGAVGGFTATANVVGGVTVVTLNAFTGAETESGSLRDGRYTLTVLANQVSAGGMQMAANFTFGDPQGFYRFYGDVAGLDRRVDISDFGFFSLAYLTPANFNPALDFNIDGRIDIADFGQFSVRYFTTLP